MTDRTYQRIPDLTNLETSPVFDGPRASSASSIEVGSDWRPGGLSIVTVTGEVDAFSAGILRRELLSVVAAGARVVVVDLDATTFMDSVTLGVLLGTLRRLQARGGELRVACANGPIRRTFELTQLGRVLPIFGTLAEAVAPTAARPA